MIRPVTRGDICWVDMPAPIGPHPAIIVSNDYLNSFADTVEVVLTSTNIKDKSYPTDADIASSGRPARASCSQIRTVDRAQIGDFLGRCTAEEMAIVNAALLESLGMSQQSSSYGEKLHTSSLRRTEEGLVVEIAADGVHVYAPIQSYDFLKEEY